MVERINYHESMIKLCKEEIKIVTAELKIVEKEIKEFKSLSLNDQIAIGKAETNLQLVNKENEIVNKLTLIKRDNKFHYSSMKIGQVVSITYQLNKNSKEINFVVENNKILGCIIYSNFINRYVIRISEAVNLRTYFGNSFSNLIFTIREFQNTNT